MENNITVKNKVFQTKDYGVFKRLNGNRIIDKTNLKNILESIKSNNLEIPIIVNEKMEICEGQHRFECKKQLNLPVDFIIKDGVNTCPSQLSHLTFVPLDKSICICCCC